MMFRVPSRDDAAARCRLVPIRQPWLDRLFRSPLPVRPAHRIRQALAHHASGDLRSRGIELITAASACAGLLGLIPASPYLPVVLVGVVVVALASAAPFNQINCRLFHAEIARAILKEQLCPSCAYDLSATVPHADNLTTCPECGAAWIVPIPRAPAP